MKNKTKQSVRVNSFCEDRAFKASHVLWQAAAIVKAMAIAAGDIEFWHAGTIYSGPLLIGKTPRRIGHALAKVSRELDALASLVCDSAKMTPHELVALANDARDVDALLAAVHVAVEGHEFGKDGDDTPTLDSMSGLDPMNIVERVMLMTHEVVESLSAMHAHKLVHDEPTLAAEAH